MVSAKAIKLIMLTQVPWILIKLFLFPNPQLELVLWVPLDYDSESYLPGCFLFFLSFVHLFIESVNQSPCYIRPTFLESSHILSLGNMTSRRLEYLFSRSYLEMDS